MWNSIDLVAGLKWGCAIGIVEATFPLLYFYIRGKNMKKRFGTSSNRWFNLGVAGVNTLLLYIPLYYGVSILLMFPVMFCTYLSLQLISDDYIHSI